MKKSVFILLYLLSIIATSNEVAIYSEIGKFNKGYIDSRLIKGYKKDTISSNMYTFGGYYIGKFDNNDTIWGIGIAQSKIGYSSIKINDNLIEQPESIITIPYIFAGLNKKYWSFTIGMSYYFDIENFKERRYVNGNLSDKQEWGLNRYKSHTFVNAKLRLFKKEGIHIEFLLARDRFSPIDGLLRLNLVLPIRSIILNTDVSILMPANNFTESDVILKSNEKINIGISYNLSNFNLGIHLGFLIKNAVGGIDSYIKLENRFSTGLNISLKF